MNLFEGICKITQLETAAPILLLAFIAAFALILVVIFRLEGGDNLWARLRE